MQASVRANLLLSSSPFHGFTLHESTIELQNEAEMVLDAPRVYLRGNLFAGNGTINVQRGTVAAQVVVNTFEGVQLHFQKIGPKSKIQLRNNKALDTNVSEGSLPGCHVVDGGFSVGCDIRATCTEGVPGDVQCSCKDSGLKDADDSDADGSKYLHGHL